MSIVQPFLNQLNRYKNYFTATFIVSLLTILWLTTSYANNQNMLRHQLSQDIQALSDEYRLLNAAATELQSPKRIEEESQRLNLVKAQGSDISYLDTRDKTVALRD